MSRFVAQRIQHTGNAFAKAWAEIMTAGRQPGVVDLSQGYPDFEDGSRTATNAAASAITGSVLSNQYSPSSGVAALRSALSRFYNRSYGVTLDPDTEVLIVTSGTEAIYATFQTFINPGDEVILFEPCFPWYIPAIQLAGGIPVPLPLPMPGFGIDETALRAAITPRTRIIIVNTPHNPTGHVLSMEELELVAKSCREHDLLALSDEVYETLTDRHTRLASLTGMHERTLTVGSAGKMFSLTGWRVGWLTGPPDLISPLRTCHSYTTFCAPTPLQMGVAAALDDPDLASTLQSVRRVIRDNAERLTAALERRGIQPLPYEGGYFLLADVGTTGMDDRAYCKWLLDAKRIVAVPISLFQTSGKPCSLVRFSCCKRPATIDAAVAALVPDA
eukprot:TRINITY_DN4153_c0_g1_i1.p2 TRINITY_DN4153_c0_g1~~TRINITY_DN4153_c0_g1_i1.p2  ORF type:complete len:389 (+),score=49.65 TRINITY_DN4153_c0_g1_i1:1261-2427(+)